MATPSTTETTPPLSENVQKDLQELLSIMANRGFASMKGNLNQYLEKWKHEELNIAITGSPGSGKSTFINTIRRLKPTDPDAAKVGTTETTTKAQQYRDP
ncbi:unnamed protein product, partial [Rotaria sordida]